eukprot:854727-Alexandrium_andersonii.AAC.1
MPSRCSAPPVASSAAAGLAYAGRSYVPTPQGPPNGRLTVAGASADDPSRPAEASSSSFV